MTTENKVWRVRKGQKIFGPMTTDQVEELRRSGRIDNGDLVSGGGDIWMPLSQWITEQAKAAEPPPLRVPAVSQPPVPTTPAYLEPIPLPQPLPLAKWTYTKNGQPAGLATEPELRQLMATGQLQPTDMVWQDGMSGPVPAGSVVRVPVPASAPRSTGRGRSRRWLGVAWIGAVLLGLALAGGAVGALWYFGMWPFKPGPVQRLYGAVSAEEITRAYKARIYTVKAPAARELISTGSGILIANNKTRGLVATNLHVISPQIDNLKQLQSLLTAQLPKLEVAVKNPTQLNFKRARVAALHRNVDLALLIIEVEAEKPSSIPILRKRALHQGEGAVALGNPLDLEFFTSNGVISSTSGEGGLIWTSCPISSGNSGGPLFINRRGVLVGINTLSLRPKQGEAQNVNGAVPAEEIVDSVHRRLADNWVWAMDLKDDVLELADMVPLEDE
jgi:S1-C subfamily serine protease